MDAVFRIIDAEIDVIINASSYSPSTSYTDSSDESYNESSCDSSDDNDLINNALIRLYKSGFVTDYFSVPDLRSLELFKKTNAYLRKENKFSTYFSYYDYFLQTELNKELSDSEWMPPECFIARVALKKYKFLQICKVLSNEAYFKKCCEIFNIIPNRIRCDKTIINYVTLPEPDLKPKLDLTDVCDYRQEITIDYCHCETTIEETHSLMCKCFEAINLLSLQERVKLFLGLSRIFRDNNFYSDYDSVLLHHNFPWYYAIYVVFPAIILIYKNTNVHKLEECIHYFRQLDINTKCTFRMNL